MKFGMSTEECYPMGVVCLLVTPLNLFLLSKLNVGVGLVVNEYILTFTTN